MFIAYINFCMFYVFGKTKYVARYLISVWLRLCVTYTCSACIMYLIGHNICLAICVISKPGSGIEGYLSAG